MMGLVQPLAVVAHDAGAANLILAWLAHAPEAAIQPYMAGPAAALWQARFPETPPQSSMDKALEGAAALLSGTGWASSVEHGARQRARSRRIPSVAVIDHWVNFRARFERDGGTILPDTIWVTDSEALLIAQRDIPEVPAIIQPNIYAMEQVAAAGPVPADGDVLFLVEPVRDAWGGDRQGEFQALDYFMAHRRAGGIAANTALRLRPHPSDPPGKYDGWIAAHAGTALDTSSDIAAALRGAKFVVGLNSAALPIALASGRTAICALPPHAPQCYLPHKAIVHLRNVVGR